MKSKINRKKKKTSLLAYFYFLGIYTNFLYFLPFTFNSTTTILVFQASCDFLGKRAIVNSTDNESPLCKHTFASTVFPDIPYRRSKALPKPPGVLDHRREEKQKENIHDRTNNPGRRGEEKGARHFPRSATKERQKEGGEGKNGRIKAERTLLLAQTPTKQNV